MARDLFHEAVKAALLKEDWIITADPLRIKIDGVKLEIDLAADKVVAAEKQGRKIAIEIKSFLNNSTITDFHAALEQIPIIFSIWQCRRILLNRFSKSVLFRKPLSCMNCDF